MPQIFHQECSKSEKELTDLQIDKCNTIKRILSKRYVIGNKNMKNCDIDNNNNLIKISIKGLSYKANYPSTDTFDEIKQTLEKLSEL